jgi:hypothetical protein
MESHCTIIVRQRLIKSRRCSGWTYDTIFATVQADRLVEWYDARNILIPRDPEMMSLLHTHIDVKIIDIDLISKVSQPAIPERLICVMKVGWLYSGRINEQR